MKGIYYFEIEVSGMDCKDGQQESSFKAGCWYGFNAV